MIFLFWMLYFVLGCITALNFRPFMDFIKKHAARLTALCLLCLSFAVWIGVENSGYNKSGGYEMRYILSSPVYPNILPYLLVSTAVLLLISSLILKKSVKLSKFLIFIGKYSFGAYLVHAFFVGRVNELVKSMFQGSSIMAAIAVSFLLTAVVSVAVSAVISRLKPGRWITGN
jgi:membrane-bound acyltransferase YfiQ involved in biofilm formation